MGVTTFQIPFQLLGRKVHGGFSPPAAEAIDLARRGDGRAGLAIAQRAWHRARELGDDHGVLEASNAASLVHLIRGDSISAVAAAMDAHQLATRLDDVSLQGHALVTLSHAAFSLGTHREVHATLLDCIGRAEVEHDGELEVRARSALGIVLGDLGVFEEAEVQLEHAFRLVHVYRNASSPARIMTNIANLHRKRAVAHLAGGYEAEAARELRETEQLALRAFGLAVSDDSIPARTDALAIRACAQDMQGSRDQALALLACAVAIGTQAGCRTSILWVLCELGKLRLVSGDAGGARSAYEQALDIASILRPNAKIQLACDALADVEARLGRVEDAARWRERAALEAIEFESRRLDIRRQLHRFFGRAR